MGLDVIGPLLLKLLACGSGSPQLLPNILKVERSKLGYIIGTIYMEMPLKPNILEDLARDVRLRRALLIRVSELSV